jgi:HK97 family phage major capsid protein
MPRYKALLDERANIVRESKEMFAAVERESRDLTDEERAKDDATAARLEVLATDIQREERRRTWENSVQTILDEATTSTATDSGIHVGTDRATERPWGTQVKPAFGEFLQAVANARINNVIDPRLNFDAAAQGMGEAIGSDGGFLVRQNMIDDINLRVAGGEILSRVDNIPISGNSNGIKINVIDEASRATGSRFGGVQGYWVDEGVAATKSKPKMHQVKLELVKLAALGYVTDELLADASALDSVMTTSFGEELRFLVEDSIINGTGAGKPKGILKAAALVSVAKESGQVAASVVYENIVKMWSRMYAPLRRNAVWLINQDVEPQLFTMSLAVGTGGIPVFMPASGAAGSPFSTLFGRPVIPVEYCQTLGTKGDIYLANFSEYAYITKGGVQTASSMHVAFTTDEMTFKATMRVDGQSKWRSALTPFKGTSTQAPFISLDVRA